MEPDDVVIAGVPSTGLIIRAGGKTLGRLRGFIVDGAHDRIRFLVVRASGLFSKARLVPFADPRVDFEQRAIDVDVDEHVVWQLRTLTPERLLTT